MKIICITPIKHLDGVCEKLETFGDLTYCPNITKAEFDLKKYPSDWFRVSIANDSGNFAWTNPVWF